MWTHGIMHGKGVSLFADGREYRGEYANGKKHGVGTLLKSHYKNGVGEQQEYREGELVAA